MKGFSLIEVLVAIVILAVGLLGLAGLQARSHQAEAESYQRSQALVLLKDMTDRMQSNKVNLSAYLAVPTYGAGTNLDCSGVAASAPAVDRDSCEWDLALRGAAVRSSGQLVGVMNLARGCISAASGTVTGTGVRVEVAWYATVRGDAPPADLDCGQGLGADDTYRRVVSEVIEVANLGT